MFIIVCIALYSHWGPKDPGEVQSSLYVRPTIPLSLCLLGLLHRFWQTFERPIIVNSACGCRPCVLQYNLHSSTLSSHRGSKEPIGVQLILYVRLSFSLSSHLRWFLAIICAAHNCVWRMRLQATGSNPLIDIIICPCACPYASTFFCPPFCPSVRSSVRPSTRPSVCPPIRLSVRLSIYPSVRPSTGPLVHPSVRPSVHPSGRPVVCPSSHLRPFEIFVLVLTSSVGVQQRDAFIPQWGPVEIICPSVSTSGRLRHFCKSKRSSCNCVQRMRTHAAD